MTSLDAMVKFTLEITGVQLVDLSKDKHTEFLVKVQALNSNWTVSRRFKEFEFLHNSIEPLLSTLNISLEFPKKSWWTNKLDPALIDYRKKSLTDYLRVLSSHMTLRCHAAVLGLFEVNSICNAASHGDINRFDYLISRGRSILEVDSAGRTPLHLSVIKRHDDILCKALYLAKV